MEGLLAGLQVGGSVDIHALVACVHDAEGLIGEIEVLIQEIGNITLKDWSTIVKVLEDIFTIVKEISADIADCKDIAPELAAIFAKFADMSVTGFLWQLGKALLFHSTEIFTDIADLKSANYTLKGFGIGDMLHLIIPDSAPQEAEESLGDWKDDLIDFLKGFLNGLKDDGAQDWGKIAECVNNLGPTWKNLEELFEELKKFSIKDITKIVAWFEKALPLIQEIIKEVKPCLSMVGNIENIISIIEDMNIASLAWKIGKALLFHGGHIWNDITAMMGENWYDRGHGFGDIIYILLF